MLRKNKMIMIGSNSSSQLVCMVSDTIFRNFEPENYISTIINEIHNSDVPDFESNCAYNFADKVVKFNDILMVPDNGINYVVDKIDLNDHIYFVNTSDKLIKIKFGGDCLSDSLRVRIMNLAPRSLMIFKLDRTELFNVQEEEGVKKKVFYKNSSDLDINLEYNIYMTRLL